MKKNIIITIALFCYVTATAQLPIPLENRNGYPSMGDYYKDINNILNPFEGTWVYTNGNTSLKIVLQKSEHVPDVSHEFIEESPYVKKTHYFSDMIIGGYQYIENGVEKINTLSNINIEDKPIYGTNILTTPYLYCEDCLPNEKRISVVFEDPITTMGGRMVFKKLMVNGQEALRVNITYVGVGRRYDEPEIIPTIPRLNGKYEYILIKQP